MKGSKQMTKRDMIEIILTDAVVAKSESKNEELNSHIESLIRKLDLTEEFQAKKNKLGLVLSYFN